MKKNTVANVIVALALLGSNGAIAEGDAERGQAVAKEWCQRCHEISLAGAFKLSPPSFASIAVFRSADDIRWRIEFPAQHTTMPRASLILNHEALDDLTAYIVSLDRPVIE